MSVFKRTKSRLKSTAGASHMEYSIAIALISITGITVVLTFGEQLQGLYFDAGGEVQSIKFGGLENGSQVPGGYLVDGVIIPESPDCWEATAGTPSIHFPHSAVYSCFTGDDSANTIKASGRSDTINANNGDDIVIYMGGADFITGGRGFDVLDLTAFNSADVVFDINQISNLNDVLFSVNDGPTVELHYQSRYPEDNIYASFNQISFKDLTLLGDDIVQRGVDDQGTSGDDVIWGSILNDIIRTSGTGADTIESHDGNDIVIYDSGDDILNDNSGFDTLDLSKYSSADVTLDIITATNPYDALVITPDGLIELNYQLRYPTSDARWAFDQIIFADETIDADGILFRAIDDQGTSGDDHIDGTTMTDPAIRPRGGNDIINTNGGGDTIIYESGNDIILRGGYFNTLDLSKYNAADVNFQMGPMNRYDVYVNTPDGVIELDYQVRKDIGVTPIIGTAVFADGSISEAEIRSRAISDQETSGNNTILGTQYSDSFSPLAGNDSVTPGDGDDSIVYTSGADVIVRGNRGSDTLDLSKYNDADVTFSLSGAGQYDIFITTPDGSVELDYQVRKPVGHVDSNIETIIFSNLTINEADIFARAQLNP
jgi:Ca2+-binding RTX toxin-like protein